MTITNTPDTDAPPAWLADAIKRREEANAAEMIKRRTDAAKQAEVINAKLRELGIIPIDSAHWTPGGYLVHARLIRPFELGEEWGVTAGVHDGVVSVFVDSGDDEYPALTRHTYVGPLTSADDVLNAVYSGAAKETAEPIEPRDHTAEALANISQARWGNLFDTAKELAPVAVMIEALTHAVLAGNTDRATVADLRYRLAAIERLIVPIAQETGGSAGLLACAVHEIARFARTPEQALELVPPEYGTILSALPR